MAYLGELEGLPSQDGQAGKFITTDGTNASWTSPKEVISVGDLLDATISSPASGQALVWNGTTWVNGFTPIQQGGGVDQLANKVYIGWNGGDLKCTVDIYDIGRIWTDYTSANYLASNGYQKLSSGLIIQWGMGTVRNGFNPFPIAFNTLLSFVISPEEGQVYINTSTNAGYTPQDIGNVCTNTRFIAIGI